MQIPRRSHGPDDDPGPAWSARGWLGTGADLIAIGTVLVTAYSLVTDSPTPQAILALALGLLTGFFMFALFRVQRRLRLAQRRYKRRARHADAGPRLATAIEKLARATTALSVTNGTTLFRQLAKDASHDLADTFGIATGRPCRVTIKEVYAPRTVPGAAASVDVKRDIAVRTVCRSHEPPRERQSEWPEIDWVRENTDFSRIMFDAEPYYISNDLPAALGDEGYRNSHWSSDMIRRKDFPYRSTVVWPVRGRPVSDEPEPDWDIVGFLCVDSTSTDVFVEELDVSTGEAFAHALYSGMALYRAAVDEVRGGDQGA